MVDEETKTIIQMSKTIERQKKVIATHAKITVVTIIIATMIVMFVLTYTPQTDVRNMKYDTKLSDSEFSVTFVQCVKPLVGNEICKPNMEKIEVSNKGV